VKKKNGFISTSVVYSFFFVFLMLLVFIISSYSNNRSILNVIKTTAKNEMEDEYLAKYLVNHNTIDFHDNSLNGGATDSSYRFSGANPQNYLCFGTNIVPCPSTNLYRIIGIFGGKTKIVHHEPLLTNSPWSEYLFNSWEYSPTNAYLNEEFWSSIGPFQSLVEESLWYVNQGLDSSVLYENAKNVYDNEIKDSKGPTKAYVGLMYVSDYAYAAYSSAWTTKPHDYNNSQTKSNNWMSTYANSWLLSRRVSASDDDNNTKAFYIDSDGKVEYDTVPLLKAIRPTFYLKTTVKREGGTGTQSDPYRITGAGIKDIFISSVSYSRTQTSIALTATASSKNPASFQYRFSSDGGTTWTNWQASNSYTFTGLKNITKYKMVVQTKTDNEESNVYSLTVSTLN